MVTSFIYWGRKIIEIFISFLLPILLLLEIVKTNTTNPSYYLGVLFSLLGLSLMIWTRFYRNKDWGFMGDDSGDVLFTGGPYKFTRHPYYAGAALTGVGIYLQLHYWLAFLMLPVILFMLYVIKKEDGFLEKKFGDRYLEYKRKVGIIPWFYISNIWKRVYFWNLFIVSVICIGLSFYICFNKYNIDKSKLFQSYIQSVIIGNPTDSIEYLSTNELGYVDEVGKWLSYIFPFFDPPWTKQVSFCFINGLEADTISLRLSIDDKSSVINILPRDTICKGVNVEDFQKLHLRVAPPYNPSNPDSGTQSNIDQIGMYIWPGYINLITLVIVLFMYFAILCSSLIGMKSLFLRSNK